MFSRASAALPAGAVISSKRLFGVFSRRESSSIDQLPDLDEKTAEKLNKEIKENQRISCLTEDDKNKLRATVINRLLSENNKKEDQHFSREIRLSDLPDDPDIQHLRREIEKSLDERYPE